MNVPGIRRGVHSAVALESENPRTPPRADLAALTIGAIGVVDGDIGTSPLYAIEQIFLGPAGFPPTPGNVLGAISLAIWTIVLIVAIKHASLVLRAENDGEGGVFALYGLLHKYTRQGARQRHQRRTAFSVSWRSRTSSAISKAWRDTRRSTCRHIQGNGSSCLAPEPFTCQAYGFFPEAAFSSVSLPASGLAPRLLCLSSRRRGPAFRRDHAGQGPVRGRRSRASISFCTKAVLPPREGILQTRDVIGALRHEVCVLL
jgi:K+ potassium transporter